MDQQTLKTRFFILTAGRTGSSLLSAILHDAGADFGVPRAISWAATDGAYEHPTLKSIALNSKKMLQFGETKPLEIKNRPFWSFHRHKMRSDLRNLLREVPFLKGDLNNLVHQSASLGYQPIVIISFRSFEGYLPSVSQLHPQSPTFHANTYNNFYKDALALLTIYGGCCIDYRDLTNKDELQWAEFLGLATGLKSESILGARNDRSRGEHSVDTVLEVFSSCKETYNQLRAASQGHFPPSRAALRTYRSKNQH